ncbi:maltokinase [Arthrobacter sp. Hiyo4]|nr:maltokinase [Arthrobacter sp. Hiyo4]
MAWIYDAVHDPSFVSAWLELIRSESGSSTGSATGHRTRSEHRLPTAHGMVKVLSGEQSNSSVIVDDGESAAIVKFFRVLSEGINPEVEVGRH